MGQRGSWKMADEAALALQSGGSPSAVAAEREAASPPAGEPLRKRPRRDGSGLGQSPGEPGGAAPEHEVPAAAGVGPAAAAGGEREAQAAATGGDNGPGLQALSREPPPADDFYDDDDDDDDEGEEEEEAAAAAIGYRGAQGAGGRDCASPPPSPGAPPGVGPGGLWRGLEARGWLGGVPLPTPALLRCAPAGPLAWLGSGPRTRPLPPLPPLPPALSPRPARRPRALRSRRAGKLLQSVLK